MTVPSRRFLLATWDGGGCTPPELGVAKRLLQRGHEVHVLADPTLAHDVEDTGCTFTPWSRAPHRSTLAKEDDLLKDWEAEDPLDVLRRLRDQLMSGPALEFAADTAVSIETFGPDAILADTELFGSVIAAQSARLPVAVLIPNMWTIPLPDFGDQTINGLVQRVVNGGLADLNAVRSEYGLGPLTSFFDQILDADRILDLSSEAFDPAAAFVPGNVRYVGPVLDEPAWVGSWVSPWPRATSEPLVLVGLSSIYQGQVQLLQRTIDALSAMEVRAVVTLGRMLDSDDVSASSNVAVVRSAPHSVLLAEAAAMVTACGHGTAMKTLAAGVPLVCIPMGRDQDATAARVADLGAGLMLAPSATIEEIGRAVHEVLTDPSYKSNARAMASTLAQEHDPIDVVLAVEELLR